MLREPNWQLICRKISQNRRKVGDSVKELAALFGFTESILERTLYQGRKLSNQELEVAYNYLEYSPKKRIYWESEKSKKPKTKRTNHHTSEKVIDMISLGLHTVKDMCDYSEISESRIRNCLKYLQKKYLVTEKLIPSYMRERKEYYFSPISKSEYFNTYLEILKILEKHTMLRSDDPKLKNLVTEELLNDLYEIDYERGGMLTPLLGTAYTHQGCFLYNVNIIGYLYAPGEE